MIVPPDISTLLAVLRVIHAPPAEIVEMVEQLEADLNLDVDIVAGPCGEDNAYYFPGEDLVVVCDELLDRPALARYIVKHELGHAVMDQWGIPQVDPEAGADNIANLLATEEELMAGIAWFMDLQKKNPKRDERTDSWHPVPLDRAWAAMCYLPDTHSRECRIYRRAVDASWGRVINLLP